MLQLSGATKVLPLKHQLGEYLANRVDTGGNDAHVIGSYRGLQIAELPARDTIIAGQTVRDTRLRERTGVSVVGLWERGKLLPAFPESRIQRDAVIVLAGTETQMTALNTLMPGERTTPPPVLIIGAGKVGHAAARALRRKGAEVHAIDRNAAALEPMREDGVTLFPGDAADRALLGEAGVEQGLVGVADDKRRCDEYLPGGVLPTTESLAADRQPYHPRAKRRSDSPCRGGLRSQLHDSWRGIGDVAAARLRTRRARGRGGVVFDRRSTVSERPPAGGVRALARVPG